MLRCFEARNECQSIPRAPCLIVSTPSVFRIKRKIATNSHQDCVQSGPAHDAKVDRPCPKKGHCSSRAWAQSSIQRLYGAQGVMLLTRFPGAGGNSNVRP